MKTYIVLPLIITMATLLGSGCMSLTRQTEVNTGQHPQLFEKEITRTARVNYLLYVPEEYQTSKKDWPLILFLHGSGERGNDVNMIGTHGPAKLIAKENKEFPFIIVSPQCPKNNQWSGGQQIADLNALLDDLVSRYRIDKQRIYVTGLSMGGYGTWHFAAAYPDRFAAIAPICGGGNPKDAASIAHLPIWVFHGAKDKSVPIKKSQDMVTALKKAGSKVKFTVYPNAGHDSWTATYNNPELYEWFLKHTLPSNE